MLTPIKTAHNVKPARGPISEYRWGALFSSAHDFVASPQGINYTERLYFGQTVEKTRTIHVCDAVEIVGRAVGENGGDHGLILQWKDFDAFRRHFVGFADLHLDLPGVCARLGDDGLRIAPDAQPLFARYLCRVAGGFPVIVAFDPHSRDDAGDGGGVKGWNGDERSLVGLAVGGRMRVAALA